MSFRDEFANTGVFYFGANNKEKDKSQPEADLERGENDYSEKQAGNFSHETFPPLEKFSRHLIVLRTTRKYCREGL